MQTNIQQVTKAVQNYFDSFPNATVDYKIQNLLIEHKAMVETGTSWGGVYGDSYFALDTVSLQELTAVLHTDEVATSEVFQ